MDLSGFAPDRTRERSQPGQSLSTGAEHLPERPEPVRTTEFVRERAMTPGENPWLGAGPNRKMPDDSARLPSIHSMSLDPPRRPSVEPEPSSRSTGLSHKVPPRHQVAAGGPNPEGAPPIFPRQLFTRPSSVFVYGPCRSLVNLTLFALAGATNPDFQWLDIGVPGEERTQFDPVRLGWIPEDRLWRVEHPDSLRPDDVGANLALFGLIRSDEPPSTLAQVTEFLRLPDISQRILARRPSDGSPGVVAVTNAHRVMAAFSPSRVPGILAVHTSAGFSILVGYSEAAGPGRTFFDFVFHVDGTSVANWRKGRLVCEKGIGSGPLSEAQPMLLPDIPLLAAVLSQVTP